MFVPASRVFVLGVALAFGLLSRVPSRSDDTKDGKPAHTVVCSGSPRDVQRAPLVGQVPPELRAADGDWLAGPPTTLAALQGKVVWLQFNF